jgi:hypothetical protein
MKRVLGMVLAVLFLTAGNLYAHCGTCGIGEPSAKSSEAMAGEKSDKLAVDLGLNDEQKAKVKAIIQEKLDKKQQLMDDKHKAMDALHEEHKAKLKEVLTEEQMKKWEEMKSSKDGMGDMKEKCPMCKDGKMCEMCKLKKQNKGYIKGEGHAHDHGKK